MSMTIDNLNVKITANATDASHALDKLANSLKKVRSALGQVGKDGTDFSTKVTRDLTALNNAIKGINNRGIEKLERLSDALEKYATAAQKMKGINVGKGVTRQLQNINNSLGTKSGSATSTGESARVKVDKEPISDGNQDDDVIDAKWKPVKEKIGLLSKFFKSIARIAFYRAIRSAMKAVAEAFSEGLKNAYLFSKQSEGFKKLADSLDRVKSLSVQMTNQLGAAFGGLKQFVQPVIEWLIEKIRIAAEWLTEFFAALNGEDTYLVAKYVQTAWDGATDSLKKYKNQLLGLDELNVLKAKDDQEDYTKYYEEKSVGADMKKVGDGWRGVVRVVSGAIQELSDILIPALGVIGAVLLFTGHPALGIGCIIGGLALWGSKAKEDTDYSEDKTAGKLEKIMNTIKDNLLLVALGLGVIGTILLFTGHIPLGLGFILGGISLWSGKMQEDEGKWEGVKSKIRKVMKNIRDHVLLVSLGLGVIGTVLLFTGHIALGLGLILGGITLWGVEKSGDSGINWESVSEKLDGVFKALKDNLIFLDIGLIALGVVFLFTGHFALGIGMLTSAALVTQYGKEELEWDGVLGKLQKAFEGIQKWWNETVMEKVRGAISWCKEKWGELEDFLHIDINGDGTTGFKRATEPITVGTKQLDWQQYPPLTSNQPKKYYSPKDLTYNAIEMALDSDSFDFFGEVASSLNEDFASHELKSWSDNLWYQILQFLPRSLFPFKAHGGFVNQGSLFVAGEAGAEIVGKMGKGSAVANTGQMTEAIYKAAYMGMSQALKENGGNGFGGFEPATTDDLFIAMKKKASKYNKRTGNSAFA